METNPSSTPSEVEKSGSKVAGRKKVLGVISFLMGLWMIQAPNYLEAFDGSPGLKIGLLILPWTVLGGLMLFSRRSWPQDELEILINRRALAFAFYGAFFGLLAFHHLQAAGVVADFSWRSRDLVAGLALLLLLGLGLTKMRYS